MNLDYIWEKFINELNTDHMILNASWKKVTGIPFLYITKSDELMITELENKIKHYSARAMKGKQLHSETIFVRTEESLFIYRHRFYVPQQKMFCCGNICEDCVRLKPSNFW